MKAKSKSDLQGVVNKFQWESHNALTNIYEHGDESHKFYVILKGVVQLQVPNPAIKNRTLLYR